VQERIWFHWLVIHSGTKQVNESLFPSFMHRFD